MNPHLDSIGKFNIPKSEIESQDQFPVPSPEQETEDQIMSHFVLCQSQYDLFPFFFLHTELIWLFCQCGQIASHAVSLAGHRKQQESRAALNIHHLQIWGVEMKDFGGVNTIILTDVN